jgi:hypothetical protein
MRNAGDGPPGGSTGRRHRVPTSAGTARSTGPASPTSPTGNAGASLFTPAYRVRHADAPSSPTLNSPADYGAGQQSGGYRWSELDQPSASYRHEDHGSGASASPWADDMQGSGYSWLTDEPANSPANSPATYQGAGSGWPSYSSEGAGAPRQGNAIRGFPPIPDEPLPVYPPGPFAAWNRGVSDRGDSRGSAASAAAADRFEPPGRGTRPTAREDPARMLTTATITPDEFDTNHSLPAIKDPVLTQKRSATGVADRGSPVASRSASRSGSTQSRATAPARSRAQAGHGSRNSSRRSKRRGAKRWPVRLAIGVAVVIIAAVAAILVITSIAKPGTNSSANNKPNQPRASTSPTPIGPGGKWGYIGTRQTDPVPLGLRELFPSSFVTSGLYYHVAIAKQAHSCRGALIGTALQAAVKRARCSQVLRASYVARLQKAMATIGVFNLATSKGASAAALHAGPAEFVAALPSKNGVTSRLGQGSGIEEAVVKGHYLVLVWAEYIDLTTPKTSKQRKHLTAFMNTLIQSTVNSSLSYRMVDGTPAPRGQGH